ncbi:MAG: hypothetical protein IPI46_00445 [Bacteroidetes bacterium]|nr:hypothetical protein [Bacteroidota bacterium]
MNYRMLIATYMLIQVAYNVSAKQEPLFKQSSFDIGMHIGSNGKMSNLTGNAVQYWNLPKCSKHIYIGLGARLSSVIGGDNLNYESAQIDVRRESNFIFSQKVDAQIDTLQPEAIQSNAINAMLSIGYQKNKWGVELGLDIAGFSFGAQQNAVLVYGENSEANRKVVAKPAPRNALLFGDNNIGMLQTSLSLNYQIKKKLKLMIGASQIRTEYIIDNPVSYTPSSELLINTDRYMQNSLSFVLGVRYTLKSKKL